MTNKMMSRAQVCLNQELSLRSTFIILKSTYLFQSTSTKLYRPGCPGHHLGLVLPCLPPGWELRQDRQLVAERRLMWRITYFVPDGQNMEIFEIYIIYRNMTQWSSDDKQDHTKYLIDLIIDIQTKHQSRVTWEWSPSHGGEGRREDQSW